MNFVRIDKYIHQYDFPTSKFLIPWKDRIEKHFFENVHPETGVYNVPNAFDEIEEYIQPRLRSLVEHYYSLDSPYGTPRLAYYGQTDRWNMQEFHNHVTEGESLVATLYLHDLKESEGGHLEFTNPPYQNIRVHPPIDKVLVFPSWLYHRPTAQTSEKLRICINWAHYSGKKPVHKITGDRW
jgi:hypothetical protein